MKIDGILNINKHTGITSFSVVSCVRRLSGERRVGHGGTLDPEAAGVLPVFLGKATRISEYSIGLRKTYQAGICVGVCTDTYDAAGKVTASGDASKISMADIEAVIRSFVGRVEQIPPPYSAVKYKGQPLYRWARAGIQTIVKPRIVDFYRIDIIEWRTPVLSLEIECGKGTYIRSLANDIGTRLGCGAHLTRLVRTRNGPFDINDSVTIHQVEHAFAAGEEDRIIYPIDAALGHLPLLTVDTEDEQALANGKPLKPDKYEPEFGHLYRAYTQDGELLAIVVFNKEENCLQPKKVLLERQGKA